MKKITLTLGLLLGIANYLNSQTGQMTRTASIQQITGKQFNNLREACIRCYNSNKADSLALLSKQLLSIAEATRNDSLIKIALGIAERYFYLNGEIKKDTDEKRRHVEAQKNLQYVLSFSSLIVLLVCHKLVKHTVKSPVNHWAVGIINAFIAFILLAGFESLLDMALHTVIEAISDRPVLTLVLFIIISKPHNWLRKILKDWFNNKQD